MIAILVAKWVADSISPSGVYDLAQAVLGHPFLDLDHALGLVQSQRDSTLVECLIPPPQTMQEITLQVPRSGLVLRHILEDKLNLLKRRGLMDAGLVLVQDGMLQGYLAEGELDFGLNELGKVWAKDTTRVKVLPLRTQTPDSEVETGFDLSHFVDRTPLTICAKAPMEYCVEMFGKLGLRYLCVVEEGSGKLVGVSISILTSHAHAEADRPDPYCR